MKTREMQHDAAKLGITLAPFWAFATGNGGAKVRLYAPTFILVCFTVMAAIGAAR
jgi:hypothetical protein